MRNVTIAEKITIFKSLAILKVVHLAFIKIVANFYCRNN